MAGHQKERAEFVPPPATKEEREKLDTTIISPTEFQMAEGGVRRRIVVDGSNFLFEGGKKAHCTQEIIDKLNPIPTLMLVYDLMHMGFEVHVYIKEYFKNAAKKMDKTIINTEVIDILELEGVLTACPDKVDDDKVILKDALDNGALILSNDQFRNHKEFPNRHRRVGYKVVNVPLPQKFDTEDARLHFGVVNRLNENFRWLSYVVPGEPDFEQVRRVAHRPGALSPAAREQLLTKIEVLADYYHYGLVKYSGEASDYYPVYLGPSRDLPPTFAKFYEMFLRWQAEQKRREMERAFDV